MPASWRTAKLDCAPPTPRKDNNACRYPLDLHKCRDSSCAVPADGGLGLTFDVLHCCSAPSMILESLTPLVAAAVERACVPYLQLIAKAEFFAEWSMSV